jgi:hypothetical protein
VKAAGRHGDDAAGDTGDRHGQRLEPARAAGAQLPVAVLPPRPDRAVRFDEHGMTGPARDRRGARGTRGGQTDPEKHPEPTDGLLHDVYRCCNEIRRERETAIENIRHRGEADCVPAGKGKEELISSATHVDGEG